MKKQEIISLINQWLGNGTINQEQTNYMIADVERVTSEKSGHNFISMIMYIGASALSLGALLLIASNWSGLSKEIKLILTLLLPIIPLSFSYWQLNVKLQEKVLGKAANILGLALVGGSLALIGQIYNLESNMVTFFWMWTILTMPFIFIFKRKENVLFSSIITALAIFFSMSDFFEDSSMTFGTITILMTIVGLIYSYVLYMIGALIRNVILWLDSGRLLRILGGTLASVILFITTFDFYAMTVIGFSYRNPTNDWRILSIVLNVVFIGFLIFTLIRSIKYEEYSFALWTVRLFGIYLLIKYFTLFYSMFDTGLFFIIGGLLFITGGWFLEKKKDILISYMRGSVQNNQNYE